MKINRPVVNAKDFNRVVLMVSGTLPELRGTHVYNYIKHGESATYASKNCIKTPVDLKGTTSVVPQVAENMRGFSP